MHRQVLSRIGFKLPMINVQNNNIAPSYLSFSLLTNAYASFRKQATPSRCEVKSQLGMGDRSFAIAAPRLWHEQPFHIRTAKSIRDRSLFLPEGAGRIWGWVMTFLMS